MFSVRYILTQRMSALETFNDSALYKCSLNNIDKKSVEAQARLRSATAGRLLLQTAEGSFYYAGPATWNSLPPHMTDMLISLFNFRKLLKTLLFH